MINLPGPGTLYRKFNVQELIDMTRKKAYHMLIVVIALAVVTVVLFVLGVSKMALDWGIAGYIISLVFALLALGYGLYSLKHEKANDNANILVRYRYEILDWISFLGTSMMAIFIIFMFFIIPSVVSQNSMEPTLSNGDRVIVYHFMYEPKPYDIVIYRKTSPFTDTIYLIKRIVAIPGDQVSFINDPEGDQQLILINGNILEGPSGERYRITAFYSQRIIDNDLENGVLKAGKYLIFGDNATQTEDGENRSEDSRRFGAVGEDDLLGRAVIRFWPFEVFE